MRRVGTTVELGTRFLGEEEVEVGNNNNGNNSNNSSAIIIPGQNKRKDCKGDGREDDVSYECCSSSHDVSSHGKGCSLPGVWPRCPCCC